MESQSCDAEPPPPPKPELRYPGITRGNTEGNAFPLCVTALAFNKLSANTNLGCYLFLLFPLFHRHAECGLLNKAPPTPTMYKYRLTHSPDKNHTALTHAYANQVRHMLTHWWDSQVTQVQPFQCWVYFHYIFPDFYLFDFKLMHQPLFCFSFWFPVGSLCLISISKWFLPLISSLCSLFVCFIRFGYNV